MKRFGLIGAAGYVAPRHMEAIRHVGGELVAALDPHDSVGILDRYFPEAHFFTEFERFDRHVDKLARSQDGSGIDYFSICSPNYLHDAHIRYALRAGGSAICEKPLVLNPWNLNALSFLEQETGRRVNTILQLRLHPAITALRDRVRAAPAEHTFNVRLTYVTSRGRWYNQSWKGDVRKSGGVATNIGVHFFDMLHFLFGRVKTNVVHLSDPARAGGFLEFDRAQAQWYLSLMGEDVPEDARAKGVGTYRSITVDGEEIEFSGGFADLHNLSYQRIVAGDGFTVEDNRVAIETVAEIRGMTPNLRLGSPHPMTLR